MFGDDYKIRKALVTLAIEKSLLDVSKPLYDKVVETLRKEHNCYLPDCYEHPEYLKQILEKLYGKAHSKIVISIQKNLEEFSYVPPIKEFLRVISQ